MTNVSAVVVTSNFLILNVSLLKRTITYQTVLAFVVLVVFLALVVLAVVDVSFAFFGFFVPLEVSPSNWIIEQTLFFFLEGGYVTN